ETAVTSRFVSDPTTYTAGDRIQIWSAGLTHFTSLRLLLIGTGSGGVDQYLAVAADQGEVYSSDGIRREHSHNGFLEWFFSFGLLGLPVMFWGMVWAWSRGRRLDASDYYPNLRTVLLVFIFFFNMATVVYMSGLFP